MNEDNESYTTFRIEQGNFCYRVMPFGQKNAGATYQRMVNVVFKDQIGRNMEVYIDDMLVKSRRVEHHITDLVEVFQIFTQTGGDLVFKSFCCSGFKTMIQNMPENKINYVSKCISAFEIVDKSWLISMDEVVGYGSCFGFIGDESRFLNCVTGRWLEVPNLIWLEEAFSMLPSQSTGNGEFEAT
ncbi:uncharacterized protein LOC122644780 [Telopea speciosissima]|uniref:uncharacterized protein LOC122644780 n=1 Tax=Telopea speciosissima TaxID=54955 RepID=UPI001CC7D033|nr:uncharacterized protein LOC122644780 [Telopea speciosissima]